MPFSEKNPTNENILKQCDIVCKNVDVIRKIVVAEETYYARNGNKLGTPWRMTDSADRLFRMMLKYNKADWFKDKPK